MTEYAFPFPHEPIADLEGGKQTRGLTLRDYFAAKAMQATIGILFDSNESKEDIAKRVAKGAYLFADAMLEARTQ